MKKTLMGIALLAGALPAQALEPEINLSGVFGIGLSWYDNDNTAAPFTDVDLENNASHFRLSAGAQEVGLRAFVAYERGASNDQLGVEDVREFFGGVSGSYGTLLYGRKATDYRLAGERLDPFYNTSVAGFRGQFASEGGGFGLSNLTNGFTSNTVAYRSPALAGFTGNVAAYVNDNTSQGTGDDADWGAGVGYANVQWLGLDAGVQVLGINGSVVANSPGETLAYRTHVTAGQGLWAAGLSYEVVDVETEPDPRHYRYLAGSYQILESLRLAASFGNVQDSPGFDGNGATIGGFYELMKSLTLYLAGRYVKLDDGTEDRVASVAAGAKFVFDVDL